MSSRLKITRRDFLNGVAIGVAAGSSLSPLELMAMSARDGVRYPPALTGLRGSHPGSFEIAHSVSWGNASWPRPERLTDKPYDLVVVGGGLSGLAAAFLYRQKAGKNARVLVLDNHDDFGGHAKRNEFDVDGRTLIGYGGSQSIDGPGSYSPGAAKILRDAGIDVSRFYDYFDRSWYRDQELAAGIYFSREKYGRDSVHPNVSRWAGDLSATAVRDIVNAYPLPDDARQGFIELLNGDTDYLPDMNREEKLGYLKTVSYTHYLRKNAAAAEEVVVLLRDTVKGYWGIGYDALSALEGYRLGMPGTAGLNLGNPDGGHDEEEDEPYIFHFPDGNAGVARALVQKLVPEAVPGSTMEDLVLARVDYGALDKAGNATRIRLNSTAVDVRHADNERFADVTYVQDGKAHRVRAEHVILACYNNIVPHICPELPKAQADAIDLATKIPLVYVSAAVRNWNAFHELGYQSFYIPQGIMMHSFGLDFPVSMGGYTFTGSPDQPTIVHGTYVPTAPDQGLSEREQHVAGRRRLYELTWDDFERDIVRQMSGALEGGGFDAERDIAALTVNRWPHGYAYEYNELYDPPEWSREHGPHQVGAARIGRISIANSDASAYAYVDGAFDAAIRAVNEQVAVS